MDRGPASPELQTRLRLIRRLLVAALLVFAAALVLNQFAPLHRIATGVLASTAVLGLIAGFAAQQVLGNVVAGILLAITQPLRIGDEVELEQGGGRVHDVNLTYTTIDTGEGALLIVPNQRLITEPLRNRTAAREAGLAGGSVPPA
jgi:small-conductance mechanosensitive channel